MKYFTEPGSGTWLYEGQAPPHCIVLKLREFPRQRQHSGKFGKLEQGMWAAGAGATVTPREVAVLATLAA